MQGGRASRPQLELHGVEWPQLELHGVQWSRAQGRPHLLLVRLVRVAFLYNDDVPHRHEKPTWRGMDLSDTVYKVYGPKKPL